MNLVQLVFGILLRAQVGLATNFSPVGDKWNPDPNLACYHRDLRVTDMVIAHPTLPCKSKVFVYNIRTKRGVWARVGDRGPKRALLDLGPAVTKALRANGWEQVIMVPEK